MDNEQSEALLEILRDIVAHFGDECHNHVPLLRAECLLDQIDGKPKTDFTGVEF